MPTLEWIGKDKVINHHLDVPYRVLDHQYTYGEASQTDVELPDGNKIIRGDNLEALKALLPQYEGRVKCIYIDPPYNTGNEGWVYNDNVNDPKIKKWLGDVVGKEGEDLCRHDKWLCMMYPRLKLLQRLLSDDGAIFISIDDNEQANLKLICDEILGYQNFIADVIWENFYGRSNAAAISPAHNHTLIYSKIGQNWKHIRNLLPRSEESKSKYKNPDNDSNGPWRLGPIFANGERHEGLMYTIVTPSGREISPPKGSHWRMTEPDFWEMVSCGRIVFGKDGANIPATKLYLNEVQSGMVPRSIWPHTEVGHTQDAKRELQSIFPEHIPFDTPKPLRLITQILQIATSQDSIILDSFAGSGTTAHAVLNMNKADGGTRKFILIEMMDYAETITAERVRRVIDGYGEGKNAVEGTRGSFGFYDLGVPLLLDNQYLNEDAPLEKIRDYVYFMETKRTTKPADGTEPYLLGDNQGAAYYFYYQRDSITTLDHDFLSKIKTKAEEYIIYADKNALSAEEMNQYHIVFKKIPRDIARL